MLVGYARVSTGDQNLDMQQDALTGADCTQLFSDRITGAAQVKESLASALSYIRPGDTLMVWKLDRLGRTVKGLIELVEQLKVKGVEFRSLTDGIDTSTSAGRFFFHVMAAMAEMERELIKERTKAGLSAAKARGRKGGRKAKMNLYKIGSARQLLASGTVATNVAKNLGVSRATLY